MRTIEIANIGPIERLSIPLPEAGVVVLHGTARGEVQGFGAKLTIGRSTRRTGEAEVITLEGRLDISQLVQPPIKDEEAADRQRIKTLIQLSGKPADPNLFESILPGDVTVGELVGTAGRSDDPVTLAGQIKRALEAEARRWEKTAEELRAELDVMHREMFHSPPCSDELWHRIRHQPGVVRAEAEMRVGVAMSRVRELETRQVTDDEIVAARKKLECARQRLEEVLSLIRTAALVDSSEKIRCKLDEAIEKADVFRQAARATDDVLSDLVGRVTSRLRVEGGRLVCDTDRGVEAFGELSPGERWRIALEIAVEQLGRGGIVTVPQEAWEALDPINRAEIAEIAKQVGVVILTAEADKHEQIEVEIVR